MTGPLPLRIDIVSDVVCPWCYVGKRRLARALEQLQGEIEPSLAWLPFQLNPEMPPEGVARPEYRLAKFGSLEHSAELDARVAKEGRGEGIDFAFERIARTPNTFIAHQLIELAQERGAGACVVDALFRAYFEQGRDVGDRDELRAIAQACGVPADALDARWADNEAAARLAGIERDLKALGIGGVPTFILGRKFALSGAHPPETLVRAIREAATEVAASP